MSQRWKNRPPGSNWGEFGSDDQLGRLNYLTEENTVKAAQ
ncbi:MAG: cyclase family protein, partial [Pseudomonadota bacterium]|nr:cyclase family protein [Pseudomonadota bacterium]